MQIAQGIEDIIFNNEPVEIVGETFRLEGLHRDSLTFSLLLDGFAEPADFSVINKDGNIVLATKVTEFNKAKEAFARIKDIFGGNINLENKGTMFFVRIDQEKFWDAINEHSTVTDYNQEIPEEDVAKLHSIKENQQITTIEIDNLTTGRLWVTLTNINFNGKMNEMISFLMETVIANYFNNRYPGTDLDNNDLSVEYEMIDHHTGGAAIKINKISLFNPTVEQRRNMMAVEDVFKVKIHIDLELSSETGVQAKTNLVQLLKDYPDLEVKDSELQWQELAEDDSQVQEDQAQAN